MGIGRFVAAVAFAIFCWPAAAPAQTYPTHPVRIVNGFGPGSAADIAARILAQHLSRDLGQQFVVEARTGAGSGIAAELAARSPKDGYTLFVLSVANVINAVLGTGPAVDPARDFAPIAPLVVLPNILVAHPSLGVSSVAELIRLAKAKPEQLFFGSAGVGTSGHLAGELFNMTAGIKLVHVPYQGSPAAVTDLLAGHTAVMFSPASTVLPHVAAGKLTALATTLARRSAAAPDLPTMVEAGVPGFDSGIWFGLTAPAGTPAEIVNRLGPATNEALKSSEVVAALAQQGMEPIGGGPKDLADLIRAETQRISVVAKAAGLKP